MSSNNSVVIIRKNISNYLPNELLDFRNAMEKLMAIRDNRGYNHIAGFHGAPDFYCWHHQRNDRTALRARLFLPWHRAYLKYLEDHLRDSNTQVSQPWWDPSSPLSHSEGIPKAYSTRTVGRKKILCLVFAFSYPGLRSRVYPILLQMRILFETQVLLLNYLNLQ